MNHDKIIIKFAVSGMADDAYQFDLRAKLTDDLNDFNAAVDTVANVTAVGTASTVTDGAKSTALAIAQLDLDKITGSDGVTLATAQALYAPSKAGDAMSLTAGGVDLIWDEVLTGATHNVTNSSGKRLRDAAGKAIDSGTAQAGSINTITLAATANATDGSYDPSMIAIIEGTGAGQTRLIFQYNGTTKIAALDRNWKVTPDATSEYVIYANPGREHVNEGLAQAGSATTITLNTLASADTDAYKGQIIFIRSGLGDDQARIIIAYNGTTKVATVHRAWDTTPNATSGYVMLPNQVETTADIVDAVLDEALSGHTTAGTLGKAIIDTEADAGLIKTDLANNTDGLGALKILIDAVNTDLSNGTDGLGALKILIDGLNNLSATGLLTTQMTESYAADGAAPTMAQALMMIQQTLSEFAISGTTITVKKLDGIATAATYTLDSSTAPTSRTRST